MRTTSMGSGGNTHLPHVTSVKNRFHPPTARINVAIARIKIINLGIRRGGKSFSKKRISKMGCSQKPKKRFGKRALCGHEARRFENIFKPSPNRSNRGPPKL